VCSFVVRLLAGLGMAWPGVAAADGGACDGVPCSGAGSCHEERGRAFCLCDEGFEAVGLECVPLEAPGDAFRYRRRAGLGERVVEVAEAQVGMGPFGVGRHASGPLDPMYRYVPRGDWWCTDFVAWVYAAAGVPFTGGSQGGWLVPGNEAVREWFRRNDLWVPSGTPGFRSFEPRPGDFVRFHTRRGGHSAVVTAVEGTTLHTVEGNVGNHVRRGRYEDFRDNGDIDGFGIVTLENAAPEVRTAEEVSTVWPGVLTVAGVVDDGGPAERPALSWEVIEGPGEVTFDDPASAQAEVAFSEPGVYVLSLTADDGELRGTGYLTVDAWEPEPPPPPAGAGASGCSAARGSPRPFAAPLLPVVLALVRRRRR